jgi:very-short-patch-repair endonuclease
MVIPCRAKVQKTCSPHCSAVKAVLTLARRKGPTSIEKVLGHLLVDVGIPFGQQLNIEGICVADFFIAPRHVIFADGDYWHRRPGVPERDARINKNLEEKGYIVLRFTETDLNTQPTRVLATLKEALSRLHPAPSNI